MFCESDMGYIHQLTPLYVSKIYCHSLTGQCSSRWTSNRPQHVRLPILPRSDDNLYSVYRRRHPRESGSQAPRRKHPPSYNGRTLGTNHRSTRFREYLPGPARRTVFPRGWVGTTDYARHEPVLQARSNLNADDNFVQCGFIGWCLLWPARIRHSRDGRTCRTQRLAVNLHSGVWEQLVCSWKTAFASSNSWDEMRRIQQPKEVEVQADDEQVWR